MNKRYLKFLKNSLITIIVILVNQAFGQYKKIPIDTNYYWSQKSLKDPNISNCNYQYQIKYVKDTVISAKTYNKYSQFGAATGNTVNPCNPDFIRHGYLRQDTLAKKVFILDAGFMEHPLYNFNKLVGDTMQVYQRDLNANVTVTITIIDSIQFTDGKYHRYQFVTSPNYGSSFIEGLGAVQGGLYAHNNIGYITYSEVFKCFGKITPFTVLHSVNTPSCSLSYVGLKDNSFSGNFIMVYPNPAKSTLIVKAENANLKDFKFTLVNSLGQVIRCDLKAQNNTTELDVEKLPSGIYFLKIQSHNELELIKFIKE